MLQKIREVSFDSNFLIDKTPAMTQQFEVFSWNVEKYNPNVHKILLEYVNQHQPSVVFISETKMESFQLSGYLKQFKGYKFIINVHTPSYYHGVAMLIQDKYQYTKLDMNLNIPTRKDSRSGNASIGRLIGIKIENLYIIGTYNPNSGVQGLKNLDYRINHWDKALFGYLQRLNIEKNKVILMGDLNVAPTKFDISNPEYMYNRWPGCTQREMDSYNQFLSLGWTDIWRNMNKSVKKYTWVGNQRRKDFGIRLDAIVCNQNLIANISSADIYSEFCESDHVPVVCKFLFL